MESFIGQRSVKSKRSRRVKARDRVSTNSMSFDDFLSSLKEAMDQDYQRSDVEELFNEMCISCDACVEWQTFHTFMLQHYKNVKESMRTCKNVPISHPSIHQCTYNKQEPIVRVLALTQSPPMRYVSVSKTGTLIVWNRHLNNRKPLEMCADPFSKSQYRKRLQGCTMDAVYMANVHKIAMATLIRDIHFFDVTTAYGFEQD